MIVSGNKYFFAIHGNRMYFCKFPCKISSGYQYCFPLTFIISLGIWWPPINIHYANRAAFPWRTFETDRSIEHLEMERHCARNCERNKAITPSFRNKTYREEEQRRKGSRSFFALITTPKKNLRLSLLASVLFGRKIKRSPWEARIPMMHSAPKMTDTASAWNK